jgi:hypothetical protein
MFFTDLTVRGNAFFNQLGLGGAVDVDGATAAMTFAGDANRIIGDVTVHDGARLVLTNAATLLIDGDLTTQTGGHTELLNDGQLTVTGNITLGGSLNSWNSGNLQLGGNLTAADPNQLAAGADHVIQFTGEVGGIHYISLPASGINTLGSIELPAGQILDIDSDITLLGDISAYGVEADIPEFRTTGPTATIHARTAGLDNVKFRNVALDVHAQTSDDQSSISSVMFTGFESTLAQMTIRIDQDSTSFTAYNIAFDDPTLESANIFVHLYGYLVDLDLLDATHGGSASDPGSSHFVVEQSGSSVNWISGAN